MCMLTDVHVSMHAHIRTGAPEAGEALHGMHACLLHSMHACMHACILTDVHACMHAYIPTRIQVLLEREKLYIAGCLTTLMSYKECLAVALQEGALDITVAILRAQDKVLCVSSSVL